MPSAPQVDEVRLMEPESRQIMYWSLKISLAIGKEGQNVLSLTGWKIDIKDRAKYDYQAEDSKFATCSSSISSTRN